MLSEARASLEQFRTADTLAEKRRAWSHFLYSADAIREKLKAGSQDAGGSTAGWWGKVTHELKGDQVFAYIQAARNSDYHGVEEVAVAEPSYFAIGPIRILLDAPEEASLAEQARAGTQERFYIDGMPATKEQVADTGLGFVGPRPAELRLVQVSNRGVAFDPATTHLGQDIDGTDPLVVGQAVMAHLASILIDAQKYVD